MTTSTGGGHDKHAGGEGFGRSCLALAPQQEQSSLPASEGRPCSKEPPTRTSASLLCSLGSPHAPSPAIPCFCFLSASRCRLPGLRSRAPHSLTHSLTRPHTRPHLLYQRGVAVFLGSAPLSGASLDECLHSLSGIPLTHPLRLLSPPQRRVAVFLGSAPLSGASLDEFLDVTAGASAFMSLGEVGPTTFTPTKHPPPQRHTAETRPAAASNRHGTHHQGEPAVPRLRQPRSNRQARWPTYFIALLQYASSRPQPACCTQRPLLARPPPPRLSPASSFCLLPGKRLLRFCEASSAAELRERCHPCLLSCLP